MAKKKAMKKYESERGPIEHAKHDPVEFARIKDDAQQLLSDYAERDLMLDEFEQYWTMKPDRPPAKDTNKTALTISPDASNRLTGAWRLLTSTEPRFSVPKEQNSPQAEQISSPLERAAKMMWQASGRILGMPQEKEAVLSALQCASVDISLTNLLLDDSGSDNHRVKMAKARTPMLLEVWFPRQGYPVRDRFGLSAYLRYYETTVGALRGDWPGIQIAYLVGRKSTDVIWCKDWLGEDYRSTWIEGDSGPFYWYENEFHMVPVISQITEGTRLYPKHDMQVRPFLYTAHRSELPRRQNLVMTAIYTLVQAIAMSAMWKHMAPPNKPNKKPEIRIMGPLSIFSMEPGEDLTPMLSKGVLDPALVQALQLADEKVGESTIYSQALGEPLGANAPFSMVALLHQAGRLPLTNPKTLTGWAIGSAMELAFHWLKLTGKDLKLSNMGETVELSASEIPDDIQFNVELDIALPQDLREQAQISQTLKGVMPMRWIREKLIPDAGQNESLQEEIWDEEMANLMAMQFYQEMQTQAQARAQAALTPPATETAPASTPTEPPAPATRPAAPPVEGATPAATVYPTG